MNIAIIGIANPINLSFKKYGKTILEAIIGVKFGGCGINLDIVKKVSKKIL